MARIAGAAKPFQSAAKEWSGSATPNSLFFGSLRSANGQKATQNIKIQKPGILVYSAKIFVISAMY